MMLLCVSAGLAFAVVVVPWILALFAVYGMVNALSTCEDTFAIAAFHVRNCCLRTALTTKLCSLYCRRCLAARTRLFQRSVERVHAATISALRHEYQASMHAMEEEAKSREPERNELLNESNASNIQIDVVYCDDVASESKSERPVGLKSLESALSSEFGGSSDSSWVIGHNGTRLHSLIGHTTFIPIDMRHHFKHDNTAYPMLRREAFIINHQIKLACTEFSYVLASLLFVCVALIAMPGASCWAARKERVTLRREGTHHLIDLADDKNRFPLRY